MEECILITDSDEEPIPLIDRISNVDEIASDKFHQEPIFSFDRIIIAI